MRKKRVNTFQTLHPTPQMLTRSKMVNLKNSKFRSNFQITKNRSNNRHFSIQLRGFLHRLVTKRVPRSSNRRHLARAFKIINFLRPSRTLNKSLLNFILASQKVFNLTKISPKLLTKKIQRRRPRKVISLKSNKKSRRTSTNLRRPLQIAQQNCQRTRENVCNNLRKV